MLLFNLTPYFTIKNLLFFFYSLAFAMILFNIILLKQEEKEQKEKLDYIHWLNKQYEESILLLTTSYFKKDSAEKN